jgi:hypothetical protein
VAFNPKYGAMGLLSYPLVVLWAPSAINEVLGLVYFGILAHFGQVRWDYTLGYCSSVSVFCIIFYNNNYIRN